MKTLKLALLGLLLSCCTLLLAQKEMAQQAYVSFPSLPCQFNWNAIVDSDGPLNFVEDNGCQTIQGPCLSFSFVKAMEAKLNIEHNFSCEDYDFSIAYLDFAGWSRDGIINLLNDGFKIPELMTTSSNGTVVPCAPFASPGCATPDAVDTEHCHCEPNVAQNGPIANGTCFTMSYVTETPEMPHEQCADFWSTTSLPMTDVRMSTSGVNLLNGSSNNILSIKNQLTNHGPLVALVNQPSILSSLRSYVVPAGFNYHSFVITGWKDVPGTNSTIWYVDDHWPGDSDLCGPGETFAISNTTFLSYMSATIGGRNWLALYRLGDTDLCYANGSSPGCEAAGAYTVNLSEQNVDCTGEPTECPALVITDIFATTSGCLKRNGANYMTATLNCNLQHAIEYQWQVSPGGAGIHSTFPCKSHIVVVPSAETVFIKVRAKGECDLQWSDWYMEEFCTKGAGGGGESDNPLRY